MAILIGGAKAFAGDTPEGDDTCKLLLAGEHLLLKAVAQKNDPAALFLINNVPGLQPTAQTDAELIAKLTAAGASAAVLNSYLGHAPNRTLTDARGRTATQLALRSDDADARAIFADQRVPGPALAVLRAVLTRLNGAGVSVADRRRVISSAWRSLAKDPSTDQRPIGSSTLEEVILDAIAANDVAFIEFARIKLPHKNDWRSFNFGSRRLGVFLEAIQHISPANVDRLRFMRDHLGVSGKFLMDAPFATFAARQRDDQFAPGFGDAQYGNHVWDIAVSGTSFGNGILSGGKDPLEPFVSRSQRTPNLEAAKFLLTELDFRPALYSVDFQYRMLSVPDARILEFLLFGDYPGRGEFLAVTKAGRYQIQGKQSGHQIVDIWSAALPTSTWLWSSPQRPGRGLPGGLDAHAIDLEKIDLLLKAGFDPAKSPGLVNQNAAYWRSSAINRDAFRELLKERGHDLSGAAEIPIR